MISNDSGLRHLIKLVAKADYRRQYFTLNRLQSMPRYQRCETDLLGEKIELVDAPSFVPMYKEIFQGHIYRFRSERSDPLFIDGGANIGLGLLYVKRHYPDCRCVAFEPDAKVFSTLQNNVQSSRMSNVTLINKALWSSETELCFHAEGSNGGSLFNTDFDRQTCVQTTRLRNYLGERVDFLKLDIEGAELEVLQDCRDLLSNVQNIFVEYHSFTGQPQRLVTLLEVLAESGFRLHIQTPAVISPSPLYERGDHLGMDLLVNIFGFRI